MNAKLLSILAATACALPALAAAEPAAAVADPTPTADVKPAPVQYQLKKRSSCNIPPNARPPFWPIGWVHHDGPHQEAPVGPAYALDEKNFAVTSILMGPPAITVINGRAYEEGQFLRLPKAATATTTTAAPAAPAAPAAAQPRIRVQRITDGQVWLACDTQIVAVGLKRPELNEKKASEEVLNEDKDDAAPTTPATAPAVSKR